MGVGVGADEARPCPTFHDPELGLYRRQKLRESFAKRLLGSVLSCANYVFLSQTDAVKWESLLGVNQQGPRPCLCYHCFL